MITIKTSVAFNYIEMNVIFHHIFEIKFHTLVANGNVFAAAHVTCYEHSSVFLCPVDTNDNLIIFIALVALGKCQKINSLIIPPFNVMMIDG